MSKYLKVLKQIDKRMTAKGYKLVSVSDGEEALSSAGNGKNAMYEWATQCDCGTMTYITPHDSANRCTFYLVYGNAIYETISDMGYNTEKAEQDCNEVQEQVSAFYEDKHRAYA
jgi:hypothetical protein